MKKASLLLVCLVFIPCSFMLKAQGRINARDQIKFNEYLASSAIAKDSLSFEKLFGNWVAFESTYYGDYQIGVYDSNKQERLEIKGNKYRRTLSGDFYNFEIDKNKLTLHTDSLPRIAYVNKLNNTEMIVTFHKDEDFVRIYFKW